MSKTATKTRKVAVDAVSGRSAATVRMYCARFSRSSALKILRLRRNFRFSDAICKLPDGLQVNETDDSRVRVRPGLVEVEGVLLVAADDGVAGHPPRRPGLDLEEAPRAHDGALGEGSARVGDRLAVRLRRGNNLNHSSPYVGDRAWSYI